MLGKLLILLGVFIAGIGLLLYLKIPIPYLGKLPGDFLIKTENVSVYIPVTTSIVLSLLLSLIFYLLSKLINTP